VVPLRSKVDRGVVRKMKPLIRAVLSIGFFLSSVGPVQACCLWPFGDWWGAGYGAAPSYGYQGVGYYAAGYAPWSPPAYGGVYSASYATGGDCCVPSCCNPCASGSCVSGSCGGVTDSGTGSLKPANDPNFKDGTQKEDYDRNLDPAPSKSLTDDPLDFEAPAPRRPRTPALDPTDDFSAPSRGGTGAPATRGLGAPSTRGTGSGTDIPFELDSDRINNKPPMPEASDLPAVESGDGSTFLEEEKSFLDQQTRAVKPHSPLAERASSFSEVLAPGRLASRSLPSTSSVRPVSWAGQSNGVKGQSGTPVRWISVPSPESHTRL